MSQVTQVLMLASYQDMKSGCIYNLPATKAEDLIERGFAQLERTIEIVKTAKETPEEQLQETTDTSNVEQETVTETNQDGSDGPESKNTASKRDTRNSGSKDTSKG